MKGGTGMKNVKKATKKTESQSFVSNLASWTTVLRNIHYFFTQSQFVKHIIQFIKEQIECKSAAMISNTQLKN